jgi:hypothetical protein
MQRFTCSCGNILFFGSFHCLKCDKQVGYDVGSDAFLAFTEEDPWKRCENGQRHGVCNWLIPKESTEKLCLSCRMNRMIPALGPDRNRVLWGRMEMAKRRLLRGLLALGLTIPGKAENRKDGLAFDIVSTQANPEITTGHLNGVITINLEEADDSYRQFNRQALGESSRTLLGHFRHESAHYFWQRYLSTMSWDDPLRLSFREVFGDEWRNYSQALKTYYEKGPAPGWEKDYITAYATSHPWEDWAETWAHYLQIIDGLETCEALGLQVKHIALPLIMLPGEAGTLPSILSVDATVDGAFLAMLQRWMCLATLLNEIANSMGEQALYPFIITIPVARKLRLAHHYAMVWGGAKV